MQEKVILRNPRKMTSTLEMTSWLIYCAVLITGVALQDKNPDKCDYEPEYCSYCGKDGQGVRAICVKNAKLKIIPGNLPANLTVLNADRNSIEQLTAKSLKNFPMLQELDLGYNDIITIENFTFLKQGLLTKLSLKVNEIAVINDGTFFGLGSLTVLDLSKNKIETLNPGVFKALVTLNTLKLAQNHIQTIPAGTFDRLDNLETLELNDNKIKVLEKASLGNLMSLRKLFLDHNELEDIDFRVFSCAPIIHLLKLNHNKLRLVPKALRSLEFLKDLSLNVNPISLIESDAFLGLKRLQFLNLSNCHISTIEQGSLQHIAQSRPDNFTLFLNANPLHCDCKLSWLREWSSFFHRLSINGTFCNSPNSLYGKFFSLIDPSEFLCTCDTCVKHSNCAGGNCSCDKEWTGNSCDLVCKPRETTSKTCIYSNGKCFCVNATSQPQRRRFHGCSFNMTTRVCGDNADIKKTGSVLDCACHDGFSGDGVQCHDIDECSHVHLCFGKSTCINTAGSYRCKCHHGYKNKMPGRSSSFCQDKDECKEMKNACHVNAECYNTEGSYECECLEGFEGDGKTCLPKPAKPVNLSVTVLSSTRALVTWSMTNFSHVAWYKAEHKDVKANKQWGQEGVMIRGPNVTSILLKDLKEDVTYKVRVGAFSSQNISCFSEKAMFSVPKDASSSGKSETYIVTAIAVMGAVILLVLLVSLVLHRRSKKMQGCQRRPNTLNTMEDLIELRMHSRVTGEVEPGSQVSSANKDPTRSCDTVDTHQQDKWEISRDRLETGRQIGEGQFGMVFEGMLVSDEGTTKVAIKTLKYDADRFDYKDLVQEMEMMKEIGQHPNVVTFIGACTSTGPLYIITEYISGGNLLDYLRSSRRSNDSYVNVMSTLSSRDLLKVALDVACGMNHVAKKKFVHRDLAARNVLLTESHVAKVADFGLARDVYTEGKYVKTGGGRVPVKWMAPESIEYQIYTTKSDVWSFGVLLWEIMTIGNMPYRFVPVNLLLRKLLQGHRMEKPPACSDELYEVMKACWQLEPEKRPTFDELCDVLIDMLSASARAYVNVVESAE